MSDLIDHPGMPRNYTIPGRTIADELERLRAALIAAMEVIVQHRTVLCHRARVTSPGDEANGLRPLERAALADYDRVIAMADAALGSER